MEQCVLVVMKVKEKIIKKHRIVSNTLFWPSSSSKLLKRLISSRVHNIEEALGGPQQLVFLQRLISTE
ncbi:unnamed protein product [Rhizophagus irregularis]|nr:unnamed protein product [Rhizophagus irregularis]CAB5200553.1 unnamed protein product [Rhizophagus irregularis]